MTPDLEFTLRRSIDLVKEKKSMSTTTENPYYTTNKHAYEPLPNDSVTCRWCHRGLPDPSHHNLPQPAPDAEGEWEVGLDPRLVYTATGNAVAMTFKDEYAAKIVSDHTLAASVPKLVEALKVARSVIFASNTVGTWDRELEHVDAALAATQIQIAEKESNDG